jgi:TorA maturation chaperone TorD
MSGAVPEGGGCLEPGEQARADVYRLLGALLAAPPGAALVETLRGITPAEAENGAPMTAAWMALQAAAAGATPAVLEDEYFNLFIGLGRGELVPYASFYLHGFLMEKVLASLRSDLAVLGISRRNGVAEPEDHAAALCETMGMIITGHGLQLNQSVFLRISVRPGQRIFTGLLRCLGSSFWRWNGNISPCRTSACRVRAAANRNRWRKQ